MRYFDTGNDPACNLAAEEWLLSATSGPVLRVWRNAPSLICGRHQIPCLEADLPEAARRGVPLLRRLSGGGTVYHDGGNLNFTILLGPDKGLSIDFARMTAPVLAALAHLGIPAEHPGRGELRLFGKKISGGAAQLARGRLLYHGTLLFSADLGALETLLSPRKGTVEAKSVRSVRSEVANLSEALPGRFAGIDAFAAEFEAALAGELGLAGESPQDFSDADRAQIAALAEKYRTDEWNAGASPAYRAKSRGGALVEVRDGRITSLSGDTDLPEGLAKALVGVFHSPSALADGFARFPGAGSPDDFFP